MIGARSTRTGRIVYDRKEHYFTWKDARRVLKSIPIGVSPDLFGEASEIWLTLAVVYWKFMLLQLDVILDVLAAVLESVALAKAAMNLLKLLKKYVPQEKV